METKDGHLNSQRENKKRREVNGTNWTELTCLFNPNQRAAEEKHFFCSAGIDVSHKISHEAHQEVLTKCTLI